MKNTHLDKSSQHTGSRLVRALADLAVSNVKVSHKNFARRLGQLIDLSDSISISRVHGAVGEEAFEPGEQSGEAVKAEFLQVRNTVVGSIIKSFDPDKGVARNRFPRPEEEVPVDGASGYEPYGKFYAAHQRDMEFKTQQLRSHVREAAAGASPELAQLAILDKALGDTLSVHSRKFFAVIPRLLRERFEHLLNSRQMAQDSRHSNSGTWLDMQALFGREMRGVLLAEVETRLLPAQGLIEAFNSEIDKKTYE